MRVAFWDSELQFSEPLDIREDGAVLWERKKGQNVAVPVAGIDLSRYKGEPFILVDGVSGLPLRRGTAPDGDDLTTMRLAEFLLSAAVSKIAHNDQDAWPEKLQKMVFWGAVAIIVLALVFGAIVLVPEMTA